MFALCDKVIDSKEKEKSGEKLPFPWQVFIIHLIAHKSLQQ